MEDAQRYGRLRAAYRPHHQWAMNSESSFELIGVEVPVSVEVLPGITVAGYMDRLVKAGDDLHGG